MRSRPKGFRLAAAGLGGLIVVLLATPDATGWVLLAWVLVMAAVAAVAFGIAVGFRHQAALDSRRRRARYITADWLHDAQLFTVGEVTELPDS
jgi:hypothetical protein